jgi:hypothetical protein
VTGHGNGWPLASTILAAGPYSHGQNLRLAKTALVSAEALQINSLIRLPLYKPERPAGVEVVGGSFQVARPRILGPGRIAGSFTPRPWVASWIRPQMPACAMALKSPTGSVRCASLTGMSRSTARATRVFGNAGAPAEAVTFRSWG